MRESIIVDERYCDYDCLTGNPNVERHHVLFGKDREKADKDGLWIPLTKQHHTEGSKQEPGVRCDIHHCQLLRVMSQMLAQTAWEKNYILENASDGEGARKAFMQRYGRSFL